VPSSSRNASDLGDFVIAKSFSHRPCTGVSLFPCFLSVPCFLLSVPRMTGVLGFASLAEVGIFFNASSIQ